MIIIKKVIKNIKKSKLTNNFFVVKSNILKY